MALAISSLPVPVSPVISTVARLGATCCTVSNTWRIAGDSPMMFSSPNLCSICSRRLTFSDFDAAAVERPLDDQFQLVEVHRLGHVVIRARLHRLHGVFDRAVGRHHDAHGRIGQGHGAAQQTHAIDPGHAQIREHHVHRRGFERLHRLLRVFGQQDVVAVLQGALQSFARVALVVNDQNGRLFRCHLVRLSSREASSSRVRFS